MNTLISKLMSRLNTYLKRRITEESCELHQGRFIKNMCPRRQSKYAKQKSKKYVSNTSGYINIQTDVLSKPCTWKTPTGFRRWNKIPKQIPTFYFVPKHKQIWSKWLMIQNTSFSHIPFSNIFYSTEFKFISIFYLN